MQPIQSARGRLLLRLSSLVLFSARVSPTLAHLLAEGVRERHGSTFHMFSKRETRDAGFIAQACMIPVLVVLSGAFAGLTLGYMSLDETQLRVLSMSGSPKQKKYARQIQPIRKDGHLLLTTLLLANMIVNETLPVVTENVLGGGIEAVVLSTVLIVVFSEIIPQSVCSRYGLFIGAKMAIPTRILIYILFVVAWPVAKVLEFFLGPHQGTMYRRNELKELINMHAEGPEHGGDLAGDTVAIVGGALDFQVKGAKDAMTPLNKVFYLDYDAVLDYETLARVVRSGHSRIPVFEEVDNGDKKMRKCVGILLVKQCVLLDPEDATPLRSVPLNKIPIVPFDEPLHGILNRFQEGRSHMALVSRVPGAQQPTIKKVTSEDSEAHKKVKETLTQRFLNKVRHKDDDDDDEKDVEKGEDSEKAKRFNNLEQGLPSDAVLSDENAEKFLKGLEGEPLGIITLEDVLEELIGEEILDEYDITGPQALPASTFVPEEAQRAVEKAQETKMARTGRVPGLRMLKRTRSTPGLEPRGQQRPPARRQSTPAPSGKPPTAAATLGTTGTMSPAEPPPRVAEEPGTDDPDPSTGEGGEPLKKHGGGEEGEDPSEPKQQRGLFKTVIAEDAWPDRKRSRDKTGPDADQGME